MNINPQTVILSAELATNSPEKNTRLTNMLEGILQDVNLSYGKGEGFFNGVLENSFVVIVNNQEEIEALKGFAFKTFNQKSILYKDANGEAYLVNSDGTEKRLGRLLEVPQEEALQQDAYTILNNKYYITKPRQGSL